MEQGVRLPKRARSAAWLLTGLAPACATLSLLAEDPRPSPSPAPAAFVDAASERRVRAQVARAPAGGEADRRTSLRTWQAPPGLLRFEERLEVTARSPRRAVEEAFAGQDLLHGPTFASAPTVAESRGPARFDANPESPSLDLLSAGLAGALALVKKLRGPGLPRYFLYEARRADGSVRLLLREGRLAPGALEQPGVSYVELAAFTRLDDARRAQAELEAAGWARPRAAPAP